MADNRGVYTAGTVDAVKVQLTFAGQTVPDLCPVHKVPTMENRHPRKILKGTGDQVKILADATDTRIRIKPGNDGIGITGHAGSFLECESVKM